MTVEDICNEFNYPIKEVKANAVTIKCNGIEIFDGVLVTEKLPIPELVPFSETNPHTTMPK